MAETPRRSWRVVILPIVLVMILYLLTRAVRSADWVDTVMVSVLVVAVAVDLATVWRRRYWMKQPAVCHLTSALGLLPRNAQGTPDAEGRPPIRNSGP